MRNTRALFAVAFGIFASILASAATFNLFSPASGVLKGVSTTYVTSAAVSSDIIGLWTGSCTSSTFLRGDGSCQTPASGGSVAGSDTQVQFNDGGAFGADADFTWAKTTNTLTLGAVGTPAIITGAANSGAAGTLLSIIGSGSSNSGSAGGAVAMTGGTSSDGVGGAVNVTGGAGAGTNRLGGVATLTGGASIGSSTGAGATVRGGAGGATGLGGGANLVGGAGGATSGAGGDASVNGGVPIEGNGGGIGINGASGVGTNRNGGGISLAPAAATGSGIPGKVTIGGTGALVSGGTTFTASGCSNSTLVGGKIAGSFASGTTGTCTVTITLPQSTNGWVCNARDLTTAANFIGQSATSTTSCTVTGTTVSGDTIVFSAMGY